MLQRITNYTKSHNTKRIEFTGNAGLLMLYFSYKTPVAFWFTSSGLRVSENVWSVTTGRHLNVIDGGNKERLPNDQFDQELRQTLEKFGLNTEYIKGLVA